MRGRLPQNVGGERRALVEVEDDDDVPPRLDVRQPFCVCLLDLQRPLHLGDAKVPGDLLGVRPHEPDGLHLDAHVRHLPLRRWLFAFLMRMVYYEAVGQLEVVRREQADIARISGVGGFVSFGTSRRVCGVSFTSIL